MTLCSHCGEPVTLHSYGTGDVDDPRTFCSRTCAIVGMSVYK